jgi:hypothetical protein
MVQLALAAAFAFFLNTPVDSAPTAVSETSSYTASDYGKCSFDSDCHKGVKCNESRCADSSGSKCSFDSDCGGGGAKCNSSKCSNAPDGKCSFDSECPGSSCSSGKCK